MGEKTFGPFPAFCGPGRTAAPRKDGWLGCWHQTTLVPSPCECKSLSCFPFGRPHANRISLLWCPRNSAQALRGWMCSCPRSSVFCCVRQKTVKPEVLLGGPQHLWAPRAASIKPRALQTCESSGWRHSLTTQTSVASSLTPSGITSVYYGKKKMALSKCSNREEI